MQAFSYMRRSRFNLRPLLTLLLFGAALVYESLGTRYLYLTPLLGVGFYYWRMHYRDKKDYFPIALFFLYTLYFEIDRQMFLFSFIVLALIYHHAVVRQLEISINCSLCIKLIYVLYAYGGYYLLNLFLAFVFNLPLPRFDILYLIYMLTDLMILVIVL